MNISFKHPTIYISHPIRGISGNIEFNCKKAEAAARRLRRVFPEVDFYVPAEHDLTLQILTNDKRLSIEDIMYADLQILSACHGYMFYEFEPSYGSRIELKKAQDIGLCNGYISDLTIEEYVFKYDIEKLSYQKLRNDFEQLVAYTIRRFKSGKKDSQ